MHKHDAFTGWMEDLHNYRGRLQWAVERISQLPHGDKAVEFLNHLQARGLNPGSVLKFATWLPKILTALDVMSAGRREVEAFIASVNSSGYRAYTKRAIWVTVKKLFQYLRMGDTSKGTPYPPEVSWIKSYISESEVEKSSRVGPDNILTADEVMRMVKATDNPRDEAMVLVLFEGAFRPGELLRMKVGSVHFMKDYCVVSTKGKTGIKRIPLIVSYSALKRWLELHPRRNDPDAPLWCALDPIHRGGRLSYGRFREKLKMIAERAGLKKDFWPYLLRHSQLTSMADKLTEAKLSLFGGWVLGTRMTRRYVHWSGRDLDRSILSLHGLAPRESSNHILTLTACPRCNGKNPPSSPRCESCGLVLDREMALRMEDDLARRVERLEEMIQKLLSQRTAS